MRETEDLTAKYFEKHQAYSTEKAMDPTPVLSPGKSQGWGSRVGCRLWGHTESDTTEAT